MKQTRSHLGEFIMVLYGFTNKAAEGFGAARDSAHYRNMSRLVFSSTATIIEFLVARLNDSVYYKPRKNVIL
jgi:hypothetical protein